MVKAALWGLVVLAVAIFMAAVFSAMARLFITVGAVAFIWCLLCICVMANSPSPENKPRRRGF